MSTSQLVVMQSEPLEKLCCVWINKLRHEESSEQGLHHCKTNCCYNIHTNILCSEGYGLLLESSVTFLMLCWTQTLCWSSSCSLRAKSSSSAFNSMSLSAISLVLQPGPTPLKHKHKHILMSREYLFYTIIDKATQIHPHSLFPQVLSHLLPDLKENR